VQHPRQRYRAYGGLAFTSSFRSELIRHSHVCRTSSLPVRRCISSEARKTLEAARASGISEVRSGDVGWVELHLASFRRRAPLYLIPPGCVGIKIRPLLHSRGMSLHGSTACVFGCCPQ
jgi:hypothetical protein